MVATVFSSIGPLSKNIASSTFTTPVVLTAQTGHGVLVGQRVKVAGHLVNTGANGSWRVSAVSGDDLTLEGSVGNGVGAGTGTLTRDHSTIAIWEAATDNALTGIVVGELYQDTPTAFDLGGATTAHTFDGSTGTSSTAYRLLRAGAGHRFNPTDLTGVLIKKTQGSVGGAIVINEAFFRLEGVGILYVDAGITSGLHRGVDVQTSDNQLDSVWCKIAVGSGTQDARCFEHTAGSRLTSLNCIAAGANDPTLGAKIGFRNNAGNATDKFYNCVAYGCQFLTGISPSYGFQLQSTSSSTIVRNCIALNNPNANGGGDFDLFTFSSFDYCISSDTSVALQAASYPGKVPSEIFNYAEADDFRGSFASPGLDAGVSLNAVFTTDFLGLTRGVYWDIGAFSGAVATALTSPTDVIESIGSGKDYASVDAWEVATRLHLISRNERRIGECYDAGMLGGLFGVIGGATTDDRRYRMLRAATGLRYDPIENSGASITASTAATLLASEDFFRIEGLKVINNGTAGAHVGIEFTGKGCIAEGCYVEVLGSLGGSDSCFYGHAKAKQQFRNCIARGAGAGTAGANFGFRALGDLASIFNCVAIDIDGSGGTSYGIFTADDLTQVTNCIAVDNDTDFGATVPALVDYCISSDSTATGPHSQTSITSAALFHAPAGRDYRLLPTSPAVNTGYSLALKFSTDFTGAKRTAPWEIGAYDGFAAPPLYPSQPIGVCSSLTQAFLIERLDSTTLAFTGHSHPLTHGGVIFSPGGGFDSSNRRAVSALRAANLEFRGAVTNDQITFEDLWSKKYDGAKVTILQLNWRFPWASPISKDVFYVESTEWTGEEWIVQLESQPVKFTQQIGERCSRDCSNQLGDAKCTFDVRGLSYYDQVVTAVDSARGIFRASGLPSHADEQAQGGKVEWLTGAQAGIVSEVLHDTNTGRIVEIQDDTPFDIQVGDTFNLIVGCLGLEDQCKNKFNNYDNFDGEPFMPSMDEALAAPNS